MSATATRTRKREPTAEQRQAAAERRGRMKELAKRIAAMSEAERSALAMEAGAIHTIEGHPLSLKNTLMVYMQHPGASIVGGFQQWRKAGRMVRKGAQSIAIWVPLAGKRDDEDADPSDDDDRGRPRFALVSLFDIGQTAEIAEAVAS